MQVFFSKFVELCRALRPDIMFDRVVNICGFTAIKTRFPEQAHAGCIPARMVEGEMEWRQSAY